MKSPDITAVLNLSREGLTARASLDSFVTCFEHARLAGLDCEQFIVLDTPDGPTQEFVNAYPIDARRQNRIFVGDLGVARNHAAMTARGRWIAFLDGDDLWPVNWLTEAFTAAKNHSTNIVWHPEFNIYFGAERRIVRHVDMDAPDFEPSALALTNCWTALCFAPTEVVRSIPYRQSDFSEGIGFEDWMWNIETAISGIRHKVVLGTSHAIRVRPNSLGRSAILRNSRPDFAPGVMDFFQSRARSR